MVNQMAKIRSVSISGCTATNCRKVQGGKCLYRHSRLNNANLWFMCHCVGVTEDKARHFSDQVVNLHRNIVTLSIHGTTMLCFPSTQAYMTAFHAPRDTLIY